jgi:hypothetical protein
MNLDEREAALIRLIEGYREGECRALLGVARAEAREILSRTYRNERARLHARVVAERAGARARIHAAWAERDTRERAGGERTNARILALAWPRLRQRLADRWRAPDSRVAWATGALEQARGLLPAGVWTVRHAPGWDAAEWRPLASALTEALQTEPRFIVDGSLTAGLVITSGGAVLDASLDGLLKDRTRIEARLLALLLGEEGGL